ncbi:MarR family winged helix-turn-helix transcriptional regulator [Nonomuraea deserti]|uniref:MarR family winged helix-turn-helix transcriptional regulator n=1 Tax=Nonomuraea deserti TaxID=1848322 RepID=UPI0014043A5F|nr:MarR family transcriptional regulator [Nonomuraea deserti]
MDQPLSHLLRASNALRAALRHSLADLDLTPVQNTVLHRIAGTPGSSSAELARYTHVAAQTMHKLIAELQQRDLLELRPRPGHGRILDAHLTGKGRQLLKEADVKARAIEDRMVAGLDEPQRRRLVELLEHCTQALDTPYDDQR